MVSNGVNIPLVELINAGIEINGVSPQASRLT